MCIFLFAPLNHSLTQQEPPSGSLHYYYSQLVKEIVRDNVLKYVHVEE